MSLFSCKAILRSLILVVTSLICPKRLSSLQSHHSDVFSDVSKLHMPQFEQPQAVAKPRIVHQQEDGTIMAVCATGSSSRDSLLSWVRLLQRDNPRLGEIPVLFTFKSPIGPVEPLSEIQGQDNVTATLTGPREPT